MRAGVRPDERAAGRPRPRRPDRAHGRRILPRPGQDVLFFVDNIFRFTQAGSEVSALLGRIPSAGRLPADARHRHGRAPGAHHHDPQGLDHLGAGDLRARRRPDRPGAGDLLRPSRRDHRALAFDRREGHLPGGRSARLDLAHARSARSSARSTTAVARQVQQILQRYKQLQDIIAILGMDELSEEDKLTVGARPQDRALPVAALPRRRGVHRVAGRVRRPRRHDQGLQGPRAPASTTTCRSRRSTWSAPSRQAVEKAKRLAAEAA